MLLLFGHFDNMPELRGPALLATVTTLTSLGFLMIGYDNGLLGGLGLLLHIPIPIVLYGLIV